MDSDKNFNDYENGAKEGDSFCQTELGKCFLFGKMTSQDNNQAYYWFDKAAAQGDEIAKMYQGNCILYGIGVPKDENKGYLLLNNALDYNYPGKGSSQNQSEQSQFTEDDLCQLFLDLGDALENGLGVYKNYKVAVYYFNMLADWGHPIGDERMSHYKKGLFGWKKID